MSDAHRRGHHLIRSDTERRGRSRRHRPRGRKNHQRPMHRIFFMIAISPRLRANTVGTTAMQRGGLCSNRRARNSSMHRLEYRLDGQF